METADTACCRYALFQPMSETMDDIVQDFLIESGENLDRLDQELVQLETHPSSKELLASIFRTIHTIKGSCGFLGFARLEKVAHSGENLLSRLRDGELKLTEELTGGLLAMVDSVRRMLADIQATGEDGVEDHFEFLERLKALSNVQPEVKTPVRLGSDTAEPIGATRQSAREISASSMTVEVTSVLAAGESGQAKPSGMVREPEMVTDTVRIGVNLLDRLMNLVGELVLARNQLMQLSLRSSDSGLQAVSQRMNLIAAELQEQVMKTRMQPIGNIWSKLPRTVRDLAHSCGKQVCLEMEGQDTELDRTIIEAIKDPLTHLVRNAVDHGFETPEARQRAGKEPAGCSRLRAYHEGGQVNIEISDDGAGLNADRIRKKAVERGLITTEQAARLAESDVFNLIFFRDFPRRRKLRTYPAGASAWTW